MGLIKRLELNDILPPFMDLMIFPYRRHRSYKLSLPVKKFILENASEVQSLPCTLRWIYEATHPILPRIKNEKEI